MRIAPALLLAAALVPVRGLAIDAPHGTYFSSTWDCSTCHIPHRATGGTLTNVPTNGLLCTTCHNNNSTSFGFPWYTSDQATPGVSGRSHHWDSNVINATYGSTTPANTAMAERISGGKILCSTCHDQHTGASLNGGTQHISPVTTVAGGATATMAVAAVPVGTAPRGFLIDIVLGGATGASTFRISHDSGISWFGWNGSAWVAGVATGRPTSLTGVGLDQTGVQVKFTGTQAVGDRWKFYVSYPFLRIPNDTSQMCEDCHVSRVQSAAYIESGGDGVKLFSHPVGVALSKPYDQATILDANGAAQGSGGADVIKTNDLNLYSGQVHCMTCHYPHNADSNSLTEDER